MSSFILVPGEHSEASVKCSEGVFFLTNYRLVFQFGGNVDHIALGVIDVLEIRKVVILYIHCKDARSYKLTFSTNEQCLDWHNRIGCTISIPDKLQNVFAFKFSNYIHLNKQDVHAFFSRQHIACQSEKLFTDEVKRLRFDEGGAWRISNANVDFELCPSYPRRIIVPSSISDKALQAASRFRSSRRIPTVVWRHSNGAVIARSSQPEVGWLWWRSSEDEELVKAIAEACAYATSSSSSSEPISPVSSIFVPPLGPQMNYSAVNGSDSEEKHIGINDRTGSEFNSDVSSLCNLPEAKLQNDIKKLLVMDARSYATAVANRARGGGCECLDYYPKCEIEFMNLDNIHTIRKSHQALRNITTLPSDIPNWLSLLESTRWLYHISGLIKASVTVAQTVALEARPVLVHCSDGWDRTPQITALAQILLDPHYRTLEGFEVLVEREWIEFGHKFADRCGTGIGTEELNERCPVFLQWLDCVHQVLIQYPTAFEFNHGYLVKLAQHIYSNMFGTFLFNSSLERSETEKLYDKLAFYSVWPFFKINNHRYTNYLFSRSSQVLYPSFHTKDLVLWKAVYMNVVDSRQDERLNTSSDASHKIKANESMMERARSCENLVKLSSPEQQRTRRLSDPNLSNSSPDLALLKSALGSEVFEDSCSTSKLFSRSPVNVSSSEISEKRASLLHLDHSTETNGCVELKKNEDQFVEATFKHENLMKVVQLKNEKASKRSFEGSTDTLVNENGTVETNDAQLHCVKAFHTSSFPAVPCSVKTSKTFSNLSDENLKMYGKNGSFSNDNCGVSVAACSFCLRSKKKLSNCLDPDIWKRFLEGDGDAFPCMILNRASETRGLKTPAEDQPFPFAPSTPNEERLNQILQDKEKFSSSLKFSDGLSNYNDTVTIRMEQIQLHHQTELEDLRCQLQTLKSFYSFFIHTKLNHLKEIHMEDQGSPHDSSGSGSEDSSVGPESSSGLSESSWEAIEDTGARTTLWVPDHAVSSCAGCYSEFWVGRRKHHCRNCGKIFCSECSEHTVPIPKENLFIPVRVCSSCFSSILEFRPKSVQITSS